MQSLNWVTELFGFGKSVENAMKKLMKQAKEGRTREEKLNEKIAELEQQVRRLKKQESELLEQLKKQQETVVRPLIDQVTVRQRELEQKEKERQHALQSLTAQSAVLRCPRLTHLYHKEERKRMTVEKRT